MRHKHVLFKLLPPLQGLSNSGEIAAFEIYIYEWSKSHPQFHPIQKKILMMQGHLLLHERQTVDSQDAHAGLKTLMQGCQIVARWPNLACSVIIFSPRS